jgi:chromosome segregation ATPase
MQHLIEITSISTALGAAGGYLVRIIFDRRKWKAENSAAELETDTKAVELFERYAAQLNPKIQALEDKQQELVDAVTSLKFENANLKIENNRLKAENGRLKAEIDGMHKQIAELQENLAKAPKPRRPRTNKKPNA